MKAIIIEDESEQAALLEDTLSGMGYECDMVANGNEGLMLVMSGKYSLAIVDVVLPGLEGLEVIRRAREAGCTIPMIVLSSKNSNEDILYGFGVQADDYITKPCNMQVLKGHIMAVMRRCERTAVSDTIGIDDLLLNRKTRRVTRGDQALALSAFEFNLLELLLSNRGRVVPYEQIKNEVWPAGRSVSNHNIAQIVDALRVNISKDGDKRGIIENMRGAGYVIW